MKTCDYSQPRRMRFHLHVLDIIPTPIAMYKNLSLFALWIAMTIYAATKLVKRTNRQLEHRLPPASEAGKRLLLHSNYARTYWEVLYMITKSLALNEAFWLSIYLYDNYVWEHYCAFPTAYLWAFYRSAFWAEHHQTWESKPLQ